MSELWQLGAVELASLMRSGGASSREVVAAHLGRIDTVSPQLDAVGAPPPIDPVTA